MNIYQRFNKKIKLELESCKSLDKAESYRPMALLSCDYKLLERLFLNGIGTGIENISPKQAGFRPNRNCTDQV